MEILEMMKSNPDDWNWDGISKNSDITMDVVESNLECPWNSEGLSRNPNLTIEFIERHQEYQWNWEQISRNEGITMEDIERHKEMPWKWEYVSMNPNLTMEFIERNRRYAWDWEAISECMRITIEILEKYKKKPWNWSNVSYNQYLKKHIINKYKDEPKEICNMSKNETIRNRMRDRINKLGIIDKLCWMYKKIKIEKIRDKSSEEMGTLKSYVSIILDVYIEELRKELEEDKKSRGDNDIMNRKYNIKISDTDIRKSKRTIGEKMKIKYHKRRKENTK